MKRMKKAVSLLLSMALLISALSIVTFASGSTVSDNLLPAAISTFDSGVGVTTHTNLVYLNEGHIYSKAVSGDALCANYYGYALNYTTPMWLLGSYIKSYAQANTATSYIVYVSMDVKGSINSAYLTLRRFGEAADGTLKNITSANLNADTYTTLAGSFTLNAEQALAAGDTWYALCLNNITRPAALGAISFDNVKLNIRAVNNLLPAAISTFDDATATATHASLAYIDAGSHITGKAVSGNALAVTYASWATTYITPEWLMGSYIRTFAQNNEASKYIVNVSMDIKGGISASLAVRDFGGSSEKILKGATALSASNYTTLSGSFVLSAEEALAAQDSWYALCTDNLSGHTGKTAYFDNIVLEITPDNNLLPTAISTFDDSTATATHASLAYIDAGSHITGKSVSGGALAVTYAGWATTYITPEWLLGAYIRSFAQNNPQAAGFKVNVSMDIKGAINARLAVRDFGGSSEQFLTGSTALTADKYTTLSGSFELTAAQALAAQDSWYALCTDSLSNHTGKTAYFDNITLTMDILLPPTTLPASISTFDAGGVTTHDQLVYMNAGHIYNTAVADGALRLNYQSYASNYTSPMWLLGYYIKNYATQNSADKYIVNVSMDVKGSINSANLALRRVGNANDNPATYLATGVACNSTDYTTLSGSFELTAAQALAAESTWYGLCLDQIVRPSALAAIYFDNIKFEILPASGFTGANLALGKDLTINYYAFLNESDVADINDISVKFTYNGKETSVAPVAYDAENGIYQFPFTGINPQCMTDNIKAELIKGETVITSIDEYSVRQNCIDLYGMTAAELNITDAECATLKKLVAALLVYGSEAQKYVAYKTDTLASAELAWAENDGTLTAPTGVKSSTANATADKIKSAGLRFENTNKIYFRIVSENTEGLKLSVKRGNGAAEVINVAELEQLSDGTYAYYTDGIYPNGYGDTFTATLTKADDDVQTVTYSVNSYIASKWNDTDMGSFVRALHYYGTYSEAFAG